MTRRTWILCALAVLALAIVGAYGWRASRSNATPPEAAAGSAGPGPQVALVTVRRGSFVDRITVQGRIGPPAGSSAKLAFAQAGLLGRMSVRVGERVRARQELASLDRSALASGEAQAASEARVANASFGAGELPTAAARSAEAKLRVATERLTTLERGGLAASSDRIGAQSIAHQAELKVATDRATLARDQTLYAGGVLAAKDVEAARALLDADRSDERAATAKVAAASASFEAAVVSARSEVATATSDLAVARSQRGILGGQAASANARLQTARIAFEGGVLRAPSDGTVVAILKHPGEPVDQTSPVLEVGPPNPSLITLSVPADSAARISVGAHATITEPQSALRADGRVETVVPAVDPTTQSVTVVVSGAPAGAVAGDAVLVSIAVRRIPGLLVPATAIVEDPQSGKTLVFVHDPHARPGDSRYIMRAVTVRGGDARTAVVDGGLQPGERVATQGAYTLLAPAGG